MRQTFSDSNVTIQHARRCYLLSQPRIPLAVATSTELACRMREAESSLLRMSAAPPLQVHENIHRFDTATSEDIPPDSPLIALRHPLGEHSVARSLKAGYGLQWRSDVERIVLDQNVDALLRSFDTSDSRHFIATVLAISAEVRGDSEGSFRGNGVRLTGDKKGWFWQFPHCSGAGDCLRSLHELLHRRSLGSALIEATVAYVVLNWMHPFADGNGRTSRVLFNALLRRWGMPGSHYLPIKEINHLARGGHEVRLRYTVATSEWQELLSYFVNVVAVYHLLSERVT